MEEGGQSLWNWKLWSFAISIWDEVIDKYTMMTYNKEVSHKVFNNSYEPLSS